MIEIPIWLILLLVMALVGLLRRVFWLNEQVEIYREAAAEAEENQRITAEAVGSIYSEALRNSLRYHHFEN